MKKRNILLVLMVFFCGATTLAAKQNLKYSFGVRITGKGKPMILIPGLKGSADTYDDVTAHYKDNFRCYIITLAGFAGQPAGTDTVHPLQTQRDEIIRFIIDNHLHKPVLVGFSFGGSLALWIASTRPDLVGPLIELDGVPFEAAVEDPKVNLDSVQSHAASEKEKDLKISAARWQKYDTYRQTEAFKKSYIAYVSKLVTGTARILQVMTWDAKSNYRATSFMLDEMDALDLRDSVAKVRSPMLVLGSWRGWDHPKTRADVEARYRLQYAPAKNVTIAFSENGKHFLMYEDLNWMLREMDAFLKKCSE